MRNRFEQAVSRCRNAFELLRSGGATEFAARLRHGPRRNLLARLAMLSQSRPARTVGDGEVPRNTINWVMTPFSAGSGGHINAMRFVSLLAARGYALRVVIDAGSWIGTAKEVTKRLHAAFGPIDAEVHVGVESAPPSYAAVATGFEQAYAVRNALVARERLYFVQDFEPWFFARGSMYQFAEDTYRFGFTGLTAGRWLADKLQGEYGMSCHPIGFSYDKSIYRPGRRADHAGRRVFFYARPATERRGFELGLLALDRLCSAVPGVTVVFAGEDLSRYTIAFAHESMGSVSVNRLPDLYRSCDLALVISMTNLSLLPLEIMACGIPVVSNTGPWVEWLLNGENAVLAEPTIATLADAMTQLLEDDAGRRRIGAAGMTFAESTSWEREGDAMAAALATLGCVPSADMPVTSARGRDARAGRA